MKNPRIFLLVGVCLFLVSASVYAQNVEDQAQEDHASGTEGDTLSEAQDAAFDAAVQRQHSNKAEGSAVPVTAINIQGTTSISTNTILSKLKTRVGSIYNDNVVSDDLKRLYRLGYFSDIKIDTDRQPDGIKIIITVTERPLIEKISLIGFKRIGMTDQRIRETLKSKEGQYLDALAVQDDIQELTSIYEKKGFSQVQIDQQVSVDQQTNKATVVLKAVEGKKKRIRRIFVEGNVNVTDRKILGLIKTKRAWLFNSGILKDEVLEEDLERVRSYYHRQGYIDVTVESELKTDPKGRFWYITLRVVEGKKYIVGDVVVTGNKDISESDIRKKIVLMQSGKVFSNEALKDDMMSIQGLYFDHGYIAARVSDSTSLNQQTGNIDITLSVDENRVYYVDKIKVRGNTKTKDVVVRRELRIHPGERFDGDKLKRSKERLQNLGFFDEISYDTEETDSYDRKNLIVDVKESKTGAFSFGGGYSSVDKLVGFIEIEQKNFDWTNWPYFTGAGQDLKLRAQLGSISQGYNLSYTEPWLWDYPVSFGFDLYKNTHERDSDVGYGYDEDVTGGDIRLGKELAEYLRGNFTYRFDSIKISNIEDSATSDLKSEEGRNDISSVETELIYDSRDNVFDTTRGDILSGSMQVAGGPFGGDKEFWKFFGRASHFIKLTDRSVLEFRGRLGLADPYGDTQKVPIYERFFAGGAYTVRGYRERKIGPLDASSGDPLGGTALLVGNLEYTFAVVNFLKVATFYDIGNVWAKQSDFGSGGYKAGTGLGLRIKTPIGPIMLDYGIPLNKESGKDKKDGGRFHFSMSHGF